ncbi:hypothetical protein GH714_021534 [Hevea brasiliensis]|uniref:GED domain-containing protein n=1 Tax=Hevea brasiliensis TaxID=3981 RepID=A0A6A6M384_HEVBR|nr:hypothetical protein GH714_021534 [Hevea brasiliensis]
MGGGNAKGSEIVNISTYMPLVSSFNDRIRPLLDAVDKLRHLRVIDEGIQLPTIVVVGDQSSGKSSVLESLAGINLPRGQGICTRVPLVMRLQNNPSPKPELSLEFNGNTVSTDEDHVSDAINDATAVIAGNGKGISNTPLTLLVKKNDVPDLTMVDLPGITRVPVHGQPHNIYEQIAGIIMEYIIPEESIILNVLSATVDFTTCESIRMSQKVDKTGERTLAVVTKADKSPEGLLEKARMEEAKLFGTHPLLSKIDKSTVGIPVLARKLTQIQATIISRCLPDIVRQVDDKLNANISELNKMPKIMASVSEAMTAFMRIIGLVEMLNQYSITLNSCPESDPTRDFLMEEIQVLEEAQGIKLPNFLGHNAFQTILWRKVEGISKMPVRFLEQVWHYIEGVVISVLTHHSSNYHQLQCSTKQAGYNIIARMKEQSTNWILEIVQMEKLTDYTCTPEYLKEWNKLMAQKHKFFAEISKSGTCKTNVEGVGEVAFADLRKHQLVLDQAFDLKMRMVAYWKIVLLRLVDCTALHLQHSINNLVNKEMEAEIVNELMVSHGGEIERMLEESPAVSGKREKLEMSIKKLKESKDVLSKILDKNDS